ncbi:hypothetical protein JKG47_01725 [Acidithiobacillus sp. MC6.1]|nr:hypothetical protein [Acidithiobacillus sp. MC6.1]
MNIFWTVLGFLLAGKVIDEDKRASIVALGLLVGIPLVFLGISSLFIGPLIFKSIPVHVFADISIASIAIGFGMIALFFLGLYLMAMRKVFSVIFPKRTKPSR